MRRYVVADFPRQSVLRWQSRQLTESERASTQHDTRSNQIHERLAARVLRCTFERDDARQYATSGLLLLNDDLNLRPRAVDEPSV